MVVQADELGLDRLTVVICPMSSETDATDAFRPVMQPSAENGLRTSSMVMTDKIIAVRRERLRQVIGRLAAADLEELDLALELVLGLAPR